MTAPFKKLTVIGLGLIGSSIARAARAHHQAMHIAAVDSNELSLGFAKKEGFVDSTTTDAAHGVEGSDIVIIATPVPILADICRAIAPALAAGTLVMDTGSVKRAPLAIMREWLPSHALVVPAHPIAGSEQSGVQAGREDLLQKKRVIITPEAPLTHEQLHKVNDFWQALGARVEAMPADMHDTIYGYVSHLTQLLAYAAAEVVTPSEKLVRFMRISHSNRALWKPVFALNSDVTLAALDRYLDAISHIVRELESAPDETAAENSTADEDALFARIAASCLITTVMEAEKKAGVPFARFVGTGFVDFTSPATDAPEGDMEGISNHHKAVLARLAAYRSALQDLRKTLE